MSLRVRFWGTRGSIPTPGAQTVRYGGNTPCVEVRTAEGWLIILDAGTGIRELGRDLLGRSNGAPIRGDLFLTHAHWDHIQGIPFFAPIFGRGNHFTIWGSESLERSFAKVLRDQMSPVVFPVSFEELDATIDFKGLPEGTPTAGEGYEATAFAVQHPGGALGYRFTAAGGGWWSLRVARRCSSTTRPTPPRNTTITRAGGIRPSPRRWIWPSKPASSNWCSPTTSRAAPMTSWTSRWRRAARW